MEEKRECQDYEQEQDASQEPLNDKVEIEDVTDENEVIMFIRDKQGTSEKRVIEELVNNLYICYVPSEEKQTLHVNTYHLKPEDKFEGMEALSEKIPDEVRGIEVPVSYDVFLLNLSPYDIEQAEYSLFRIFDPDNPGERAMLWKGKAENLPANSATTPTVKFDEDFGYHDIFGWTLTVKELQDKVCISYSDLRACMMFRSEDYKDIPAINKKGYLYKVETSEKPQRDMIFAIGWEKIKPETEEGVEREAGYNVEYFRYLQRQAETKPAPKPPKDKGSKYDINWGFLIFLFICLHLYRLLANLFK